MVERPVRPVTLMTTKPDLTKHELVPKHVKLSEKEPKALFERYALSMQNLPRIFRKDPAVINLDLKEGDIVKISRASATAGETVFYRRVVE